jgi:hypothetical protein
LDIPYTEITLLNKALDKLDKKDELNTKLLQQHMPNDKQIKILNKIEAIGDKNYAKYNKDIYERYIKRLVRDYESHPKNKQFRYPHFVPRKFFLTVDDIMANLKKKYWNASSGTTVDNEITKDELNKTAEVDTNISNQMQDLSEVMNAYFKDICNNTYRNKIIQIIKEVTPSDL